MGREFVGLFNNWANSYDETVNDRKHEYHEVFEGYDSILARVAEQAKGSVLEFGVGTGNLTNQLLINGHKVFGVEPSKAMRDKFMERFPDLALSDGDFLQYPEIGPVDTIVSTYAFHHLTDQEKRSAVETYSRSLPKGGKIVFADTLFENENSREQLLQHVEQQGYKDLLFDLQTEYYTIRDVLENIFTSNGFNVAFTKLNRYVWLIDAVKIK